MDAEERYESLVKALDELREENATTPILVEGVRDQQALRQLGVQGEIRIYNSGKSVADVAEWISRSQRRVIVLLDWDRTGGHLVRRLSQHLHAQVDLELDYRRRFATYSLVRCVENLPAALRHLRKQAGIKSDDEE